MIVLDRGGAIAEATESCREATVPTMEPVMGRRPERARNQGYEQQGGCKAIVRTVEPVMGRRPERARSQDHKQRGCCENVNEVEETP